MGSAAWFAGANRAVSAICWRRRSGNDDLHLGDGVSRGFSQFQIGPGFEDPSAEHACLCFLFGKHNWRQIAPSPKHVDDARFTIDGDATAHEITDIAVDRAFRYFKFLSQVLRPREFAAAQDLVNLEESIGAAHIRAPYGPSRNGTS